MESLLALMKQQPVSVLPSVTRKMECKYWRYNVLKFLPISKISFQFVSHFLCRTSVAHLDSPNVVDMGLSQMVSRLVEPNKDVELDVFFFNSQIAFA